MLNAGLPPLGWGPCAEARAFFVRATTLPRSYYLSYDNLIRQLILAGVWQKLDALYVFATFNSATALLNLVSSSFANTANGSPTFAANRGYTGTDGSATVYLDTGLNPSTATSPQFVLNSAHVAAWVATDVKASASGGAAIGHLDTGAANTITDVTPHYVDDLMYLRANEAPGGPGVTPTGYTGHCVASRTGASAQQGYVNGVSQGLAATNSTSLCNANLYILARNLVGTGAQLGCGNQIAAASIGAGLSAGEASLFYLALRQFMILRGVTVP